MNMGGKEIEGRGVRLRTRQRPDSDGEVGGKGDKLPSTMGNSGSSSDHHIQNIKLLANDTRYFGGNLIEQNKGSSVQGTRYFFVDKVESLKWLRGGETELDGSLSKPRTQNQYASNLP